MITPFDVTIDLGGIEVNVIGTYDAGRPANLKGHPDTWTPAEGEELEVTELKTTDGHAIEFESSEFADKWRDQIVEAIYG